MVKKQMERVQIQVNTRVWNQAQQPVLDQVIDQVRDQVIDQVWRREVVPELERVDEELQW